MINLNINNKLIFFLKIVFVYVFLFSQSLASENYKLKEIVEGKNDAKIKILVYESLTCPHCAAFHKEVYPKKWILEITKEKALSWIDEEWNEKLKESALKRIKPWMWRRNAKAIQISNKL